MKRFKLKKKPQSELLPTEDILLAFRFCYYVHSISIIPDQDYDKWETAHMKSHPESKLLDVGSDNKDDYSPRIRALGLYFALCLPRQKKKFKLKFLRRK